MGEGKGDLCKLKCLHDTPNSSTKINNSTVLIQLKSTTVV